MLEDRTWQVMAVLADDEDTMLVMFRVGEGVGMKKHIT